MQITVSDSGSRFKVRAVLMFWHTGCSVSLIKEPLDLKQYCVHFLQSTSFSTTLSKLSISGQSISPLTLTCLLCVLPHHCQSYQLFRKLIISLLYLTRNVVSSSSAHVWIVHVSMHVCAWLRVCVQAQCTQWLFSHNGSHKDFRWLLSGQTEGVERSYSHRVYTQN